MKRFQRVTLSVLLALFAASAIVAADGKITAQRLQVSKDGVRPPQ